MNRGIAVAGNIMMDTIKHVNGYPSAGMLAHIISTEVSVGGVLGNTLVDLAVIDPSLKLVAVGCVGNDENGRLAKAHLLEYGINIEQLVEIDYKPTSFTDVIQDRTTGQRTFFCFGGANDAFDFKRIDFEKLDVDIFHIGYALLLKGMDAPDPEFGTVMARTLARVQQLGIRTSMDIVSDSRLNAAEIIRHNIKYCNYLIINETEGSIATGIPVRDNRGHLDTNNLKQVCRELLRLGVNDWVVIHYPEGSIAMDSNLNDYVQSSFNLPAGFIKGSVGAGDAFCAGMLYGFYREWNINQSMHFANASAAACLEGAGGTESMRSAFEITALADQLKGPSQSPNDRIL